MSASSVNRALPLALVLAAGACVAYDTAGPEVPALDGTWQARFAIAFENQIEVRADTLRGELTLRDTHYRGRFTGSYRIGVEVGAFGGVIRPESTLVVYELGAPPTPIAAVDTVRRLYPRCDFTRLDTGGLAGRLSADTLSADGQASLPCFYSQLDREVEFLTTLTIQVRAVRRAI